MNFLTVGLPSLLFTDRVLANGNKEVCVCSFHLISVEPSTTVSKKCIKPILAQSFPIIALSYSRFIWLVLGYYNQTNLLSDWEYEIWENTRTVLIIFELATETRQKNMLNA